jgi:hypothetical protein
LTRTSHILETAEQQLELAGMMEGMKKEWDPIYTVLQPKLIG